MKETKRFLFLDVSGRRATPLPSSYSWSALRNPSDFRPKTKSPTETKPKFATIPTTRQTPSDFCSSARRRVGFALLPKSKRCGDAKSLPENAKWGVSKVAVSPNSEPPKRAPKASRRAGCRQRAPPATPTLAVPAAATAKPTGARATKTNAGRATAPTAPAPARPSRAEGSAAKERPEPESLAVAKLDVTRRPSPSG